MSLNGKSVYFIHDVDNIQFGSVVNERMDGNWKWVQVNWTNGAPTNKYKAPNINIKDNWFRIDTVRIFKPIDMINSLQQL